MKDKMKLLNKESTGKPIQQAKARPQETMEFKVLKSIDTFSHKRSLGLEEGKWMLAVTSFKYKC